MSFVLRVETTTRAWARRSGLTPAFGRLRGAFLGGGSVGGYEELFSKALLDAARPGDCVWDVGANVGHYTSLLSERVGRAGMVYAFEPAPACFEKLLHLRLPNVRAFNLALGDAESRLPLAIAEDPLGTTHCLVERGAATTAQTLEVRVARGDDILREIGGRIPNLIKIDVEGFEEEVMSGIAQTLKHPECRAVLCEVHFGILEKLGKRHAPSRIEGCLRHLGFRTRWIDASHLSALKTGRQLHEETS